MKVVIALLGCLAPAIVQACDRPVCLSAEKLRLSDVVTFDDQPSGMGPGRPVEGLLHLPGASFGERFAGQSLTAEDSYDLVSGPGDGPLTLLPGSEGQNLSVLRLLGTNVLSGDGPAGFPRVEATGEGAMAILFTEDQAALRLVLRGGEGGVVTVLFLERSGTIIDSHTLGPLSESTFDFNRLGGVTDIAGVVLNNYDPQGIALDEVAFGIDMPTSKAAR